MAATTLILHGGNLGSETIRVRCDLDRAESPIEADYGVGHWVPTQYQCSDCSHIHGELAEIGKRLAAVALEQPVDTFDCEWEIE